jgi:hypothetical protein
LWLSAKPEQSDPVGSHDRLGSLVREFLRQGCMSPPLVAPVRSAGEAPGQFGKRRFAERQGKFALYRVGDAWAACNIPAATLDAMRVCMNL